MLISRINAFHHRVLATFVRPGDIVVDGTVGNGHDALFLLQAVGAAGRLYGFDVQEAALQSTRQRLEGAGHHPDRYSLIKGSHTDVARYVPTGIGAAVFNLGYLPGGDRSVATEPAAVIRAVEGCLRLLRPEGVVSITLYYGHKGGREEAEEILAFAGGLDHREWKVLHLSYDNLPKNPPSILFIQRD